MIRKTVIAAASGAVILAGGTAAVAATAASSSSNVTYHGCESTANNREIFDVYSTKTPKCPSGAWQITFNSQGQQGPSGVVATSNTQLVSSPPQSVPTGGSFSAKRVQVGSPMKLDQGTYLINLNFMATPNTASTGAIFPSMYVYNGPQANGSFSNDLFNVGSGSLEQASAQQVAQNPIDSYFSGSGEITVPQGGETLYFYAFGYDSDSGASTYALDSAVATVTQVNAGS